MNRERPMCWRNRLVGLLWPHAPAIGRPDRIWCGFTKHKDGCYRKCRIIGYQIEIGDNGETLLVKVKMNQRHPLIERVHLSHIDCLESYAKKPNDPN